MSKFKPLIKICGVTSVDQAIQIAELGVDAIGIISVKESPRYISQQNKNHIFQKLKNCFPKIKRVSVYKDIPLDILKPSDNNTLNENVIQLHGDETPDYCSKLKDLIPSIEIWKAFRIQSQNELICLKDFENSVDAILLDSWDKEAYGGTGKRIKGIDFKKLVTNKPWWLAGGVSSDWTEYILKEIKPDGIDISSSIEVSPGKKDIEKTKLIIEKIRNFDKL